MLISWARMVPVVALAWKAEARQPAARVRLNAIAASTSQAPPWHHPDRPDPTTRRQAQPEPKWKSRADRPSPISPAVRRFSCPVDGCGQQACPVHDAEDKQWRHLDFFQHEAYMQACLRAPRGRVQSAV